MPTASSRNSPRASLAEVVAASLRGHVAAGARVAVALSGGRDSAALLDVLARLAGDASLPPHLLSAVHVHHGLQPAADEWASLCAALCAERRIELSVIRVDVARAGGESVEQNARVARYRALASAGADVVALAHHLDDQVETLLLQLLRGAGPQGLAAMAAFEPGRPAWWRPFLGVPRAAIDSHVAAHRVAFVDDDSNADDAVPRNLLRRRVLPLIEPRFPGYRSAIARAARHQAAAATLLDALAAIDLGIGAVPAAAGALRRASRGVPARATAYRFRASLPLATLRSLAPERAANALRAWVGGQGMRAPSAARLAEWHAQLVSPRPQRVVLVHEGAILGVHRDQLVVRAPGVDPFEVEWHGESRIALPHGELLLDGATGAGVAAAKLAAGRVLVRSRRGGERLRLRRDGPRRMLKTVLHELGVPAWERDALPLLVVDDALAAIPGVGIDPAFAAGPGEPGLLVDWRPASAPGPADEPG